MPSPLSSTPTLRKGPKEWSPQISCITPFLYNSKVRKNIEAEIPCNIFS